MKKKLTILYCITLLSFLLGIYKGKIALWKKGEEHPIKVFPYSAALLPKEDREKLEKGMEFRDLEELTKFAADYLS